MQRTRALPYVILLSHFFLSHLAAQSIRLEVDATEGPGRIFHSTMRMPVKSGTLSLNYPKWFPGTHGPTGQISDLVGLRISSGGQNLAWKRDPVDMYRFHCDIPNGLSEVTVSFDFVVPSELLGAHHPSASSPYTAMISWTSLLLYPSGTPVESLMYAPVLRLPQGWKYGTALATRSASGDTFEFEPVSLYTLIDSPVVAGKHFRTIDLADAGGVPYFMHLAADSAAALEVKPEVVTGYKKLMRELMKLFGARHFEQYHFLVTLSDPIEGSAVEHHESSDNRPPERMFLDEEPYLYWADTLAHEMVHSWNGKYRRPAGLDTADYQVTIRSDLLWVYEGLTNYLGFVAAARSGLMTAEQFQEAMAWIAAGQDRRPGRLWKPLLDTTVAAQILGDASGEWNAYRRGLDYYNEGTLIWLEADMIIRRETRGRASLDDFCRAFFGGMNGSPAVVPYTLDDVKAALSAVASHDWNELFAARVDRVNPRAPTGGIEAAGWRLSYGAEPTSYHKAAMDSEGQIDLRHSCGLVLDDEGRVSDVIPDSSAAKAGVVPGMEILGVDGRRWSKSRIEETLSRSDRSTEPTELLLQDREFYKLVKMDYHDGARYPVLERIPNTADELSKIISPRSEAKN